MPAATEKPGKPARTPRGNDLAKIHIAAKQLGLDEPTYRDMLWSIGRCRSAKYLDHAGRKRVLDHLVSRGARIGRNPRTGEKITIPSGRHVAFAPTTALKAAVRLP